MRAPLTVTVVLLLLLHAPMTARPDEQYIDPDRPDVSTNPFTVGRGVVQLETGIEYARTSLAASPAERRFAVQGNLRIGIVEPLEVQLESEPIVHLAGADDDTGIGDLRLALKYQFFQPASGSSWPTLAVLPFVKIPTAQRPIGTREPDGGVLGIGSLELPADFDLEVNAGVAALGQARDGALVQALTSASLSLALTRKVQPFVEFFFQTREDRDGNDQAGLNLGVLYFVTPSLALDAAVQASLLGSGPDYALRTGLSVRFGR